MNVTGRGNFPMLQSMVREDHHLQSIFKPFILCKLIDVLTYVPSLSK